MRRRTLPPPLPGTVPAMQRPPDALVHSHNRRRRRLTWILAATTCLALIGVGALVVALNDGRSALPSQVDESTSSPAPTTEPSSAPSVVEVADSTRAPLTVELTTAAPIPPPATNSADTSTAPSSASAVSSLPAPPPSAPAPAPTAVPTTVVLTPTAPTTPPPQGGLLTSDAGQTPLSPLADDLRLVVATPDGVMVETAAGVKEVLDVDAEVAIQLAPNDLVFQRRRGRPTGESAWTVSATNIERRRGTESAVIVVANDFGYLSLRQVVMRGGAPIVLYQIDRPKVAATDGELRRLNLLEGITTRAGRVSAETPPQRPNVDLLTAFGISNGLAVSVTDIDAANGVFVLNRVGANGARMTALIVDGRLGAPTVSELTTPGRATLPMG